MHITKKTTLHKNINELRAQGYEIDDDNEPLPDNIPNPETQQDTPTYKPWGWYGIGRKKLAVYCHERARMFVFGEESLRRITYLTTF